MNIYKATIDDYSFLIADGDPVESFKRGVINAVRAGGDLIHVSVLANSPIWLLITPHTQVRLEKGMTGMPVSTAVHPIPEMADFLSPYSELLDDF